LALSVINSIQLIYEVDFSLANRASSVPRCRRAVAVKQWRPFQASIHISWNLSYHCSSPPSLQSKRD